ncbi:MAG: hypothetical protein C4551_10210 [Bacillota bacterium]|nr:MAG: hypothetical protein C4551_10210 [Bacillota bacterium]
MKAISLWPPYGHLMAAMIQTPDGPRPAKGIETRDWATDYRGPIAIHATVKFPQECVDFCYEAPIERVLRHYLKWLKGEIPPAVFHTLLPRRAIVAVGYLEDCRPTGYLLPRISHLERLCGNYGPGRFGFDVKGIIPLKEPIECPGAQMLWEVPAGIARQLEALAQERARAGLAGIAGTVKSARA